TAFAVAVLGVHLAEVFLPQQLAGGVEAVEAVGAEEGEDTLAVGDRRGRGEAGGVVAGLVRGGLVHRLLPDDLAGLAADREHGELVVVSRTQVVVSARADEARRDRLAVGDRRGQEDLVAPNNRRRVAFAR